MDLLRIWARNPLTQLLGDQFLDQKFDYILANPTLIISDWGRENYESDPRWVYGRPPIGNANHTWLQHRLWKLCPGREAGVVLANGSICSNTSGEGQIREAMVRGDGVEGICDAAWSVVSQHSASILRFL